MKRHVSCRWVIGLAFTSGMTMAASARAEENHSADEGHFALEFEECPKTLAEGVRRCIGIEVGNLLHGPTEGVPVGSDRLTIRCGGVFAWIEAAGAADSAPVEKLLRLDEFPGDAAPRALALASLELMAARSSTVRERINGMRNSLPPARTRPSTTSPPAAAPRPAAAEPGPKSAESARETRIGLAGGWRTFLVERGPSLWGGQVQASTRVSGTWQAAADADVGGAHSRVENLGETSALLLSCGATFGVRTGDSNLGASFGLGGRIGVARLWGSSADPANVSAATVWRPWGGPMAAAGFFGGFWRFALTFIAEAGHSLLEPEGQAGGTTVISLRGPWAAIYLGAGVRP